MNTWFPHGVGRTRRIQFYATQADLKRLFQRIEAHARLTYYKVGEFDSLRQMRCHSGLDLPHLGFLSDRYYEDQPVYLATYRGSLFFPAPVLLKGLKFQYRVTTASLPRAITLMPGGRFDENTILLGQLVTNSSHPHAHSLMMSFVQAIRAVFTRVRAAFVGSEALTCLDAGARLTPCVDFSSDYDLQR